MTTYQKYRAQGLCARCCRVRCETAYCETCERARASQRKLIYRARVAAGICVQCGGPSDGHPKCGVCRQIAKERDVLGMAAA